MNKKETDLLESVVFSLDGSDRELYPYLPYLLQDLWEIGAVADIIIALLQRHGIHRKRNFRVLDLGCGKGIISVKLAKSLGVMVDGFDGMPAFIEEARQWADKYRVMDSCQFTVADIREQVKSLKNYDLVVLGSIGPVFGDVERTLSRVAGCLKQGGYVILDDGYLPEDSQMELPMVFKRSEVLNQISHSGMKVLEEHIMDSSAISESDAEIYASIEMRARELTGKYPQKKELFTNYLKSQREENEILENVMVCATWLLQRRK